MVIIQMAHVLSSSGGRVGTFPLDILIHPNVGSSSSSSGEEEEGAVVVVEEEEAVVVVVMVEVEVEADSKDR